MWWFLAFILALPLAGGKAQELSLPDAQRVPVPQPQNVRVEHRKDTFLIDWDITPLKRVTAYEVFKKVEGRAPTVVARVSKPPYATPVSPSPRVEFFVVAVDYRNNRSKPSHPVTVDAKEEK
jgi:hypothetical protein